MPHSICDLMPLLLQVSSQDPREVDDAHAQVDTPRVETFLLEEACEQADGSGTRFCFEPVGLVTVRRSPARGGLLIEEEIIFAENLVRIQLSELHRVNDVNLVWRELRSSKGRGRTWCARWQRQAAQVSTLRWGLGAEVHGSLQKSQSLLAPLELLERLRWDVELPGQVVSLDPLTERTLTLKVRRIDGDMRSSAGLNQNPSAGLRSYELLSLAGETVAAYVFEGQKLLAMRWQSGRWARRISETQFGKLLEDFRAADRREQRTTAPGPAAVSPELPSIQ